MSLRGVRDDEAVSAEDKDCFAPLLGNKMLNPCHTPWMPASAGMTNTPVIPCEQRETWYPGASCCCLHA